MGAIPAICFVSVGEIGSTPAAVAVGLSALAVSDSLGGIVAPLVCSTIVEEWGFGLVLACVTAAIPALAALFVFFGGRKTDKKAKGW